MNPPRSEGFVRMPDAEFEAILTRAAEEGALPLPKPNLIGLNSRQEALPKPLNAMLCHRCGCPGTSWMLFPTTSDEGQHALILPRLLQLPIAWRWTARSGQ